MLDKTNESSFILQGGCLVYLKREGTSVCFFCDGFITLDALKQLPNVGRIKVLDFAMESHRDGDANSYKWYSLDDFNPIESTKEIITFISLIKGTYINVLEVEGSDFLINIYDSRNFTITFNIEKYRDFYNTGIKNLLINCLFLDEIASTDVIESMRINNDNYLLINEDGKTLRIFKDFDEYLASGVYNELPYH
jgi:hypothetical protein